MGAFTFPLDVAWCLKICVVDVFLVCPTTSLSFPLEFARCLILCCDVLLVCPFFPSPLRKPCQVSHEVVSKDLPLLPFKTISCLVFVRDLSRGAITAPALTLSQRQIWNHWPWKLCIPKMFSNLSVTPCFTHPLVLKHQQEISTQKYNFSQFCLNGIWCVGRCWVLACKMGFHDCDASMVFWPIPNRWSPVKVQAQRVGPVHVDDSHVARRHNWAIGFVSNFGSAKCHGLSYLCLKPLSNMALNGP